MFANSQSVQPYKYNGEELDRKGGLDWYDYGARHYDAEIGRWHTIDPMAEKFYDWSPYTYCLNNPVKLIDPNGKQPRPARPVRRGYRNGGRFNPYALYAREMKPQSYIQTTQFSYKGNGLIETVAMGAQNILEEVGTPGGNNVQMSRDNRKGQFLSGIGDLWDAHNESMKNIFSFDTVVQYGDNGIIKKSTDIVITDTKLALQQIEYERNVRSIEKQLGELDFAGKSLKEIIEISAERKNVIYQKLGMSPKEKLWIQFFNDPESFQSQQSRRSIIPEFKQY